MVYESDPEKHICTIIREAEDVTVLIDLQEQLKQKIEQLKLISFKTSHLLRSPVASIAGLIDLIEERGIIGGHNKQILHYLKEAITRLDNIIREINDAAKLN